MPHPSCGSYFVDFKVKEVTLIGEPLGESQETWPDGFDLAGGICHRARDSPGHRIRSAAAERAWEVLLRLMGDTYVG